MKDPYEILGVSRNASTQEIKEAYRALAKKYHPDNFNGTDLQEVANEKMQEINEAYDAIVSGTARQYGGYSGSSYGSSSSGNFDYIRSLIDSNRLDQAEQLLNQVNIGGRNAHWYYLMGRVCYNRGWIDQAYTYFSTSYSMNPNNPEYANAYQNLSSQRNGAFRTSKKSRDSDICDVCCSLLCLDQCCECMGGDLIPCC